MHFLVIKAIFSFAPNCLTKKLTMKKVITLCFLLYIGVGCNNPADKSLPKTDSVASDKPVYAYTIKNPDNWEIGSSKNTALVLSSLKAFENNKIDESLVNFADSVVWREDEIDGKFSKDSLKGMFTAAWKETKSIKIDMNDFESVISKDKKDEWVTLWYKQTMTNMKGKTDSMAVIDDLKIANGKIIELNGYRRALKAKK